MIKKAVRAVRVTVMAVGLALGMAGALSAQSAWPVCEFPEPEGPVMLNITIQGADGTQRVLELDRAGLMALPQEEFQTTTIWTQGVQEFRGPRLLRLMECLGVTRGVMRLCARNSYFVEIDVADLRPDGALIAVERNGAPLSVRDKGPLWLMYPFDSDPSFRSETFYAQSIWHLERIGIEP
ncbi:oxidoreductase [Lutimaribacter sp. EGI FJ00015]|uniref:Oxidoreductase n=1 Tax=Lutimaribacter degradans TaxID=2945989 RepID=A0ACC5ZWX0_9RHOB|nr:oxidoreductase [Lutimaribacter sp. EGI FJ00013]MCM2562266.1 oxidoreductase [Lutimaribacter sp. EGI FJ00013]MCO0613421.1 oxidoreductase [Lutimaribacter sp. EGI FJ00015]MCO0636395.1 oxidoreductase [Lutimaribacter sp. EGI FJ00014]